MGTTVGGCTGLGDASEDSPGPGGRSAHWQGTGPLQGGEHRIRAPSTRTPEHSPPPSPTGHSLSDELDGVLVLHPALDEGQSHEDRSPRADGRTRSAEPLLPTRPLTGRLLKTQSNAFPLGA